MRADLDEGKLRHVHVSMGVPARASHMGRRTKIAIQAVAPAMVGTADGAADVGWSSHQDHAAVAAGILENPNAAIAVAYDQEGHSEEGDRPGVAGLGNVLAESDAGPACKQNGPLLL